MYNSRKPVAHIGNQNFREEHHKEPILDRAVSGSDGAKGCAREYVPSLPGISGRFLKQGAKPLRGALGAVFRNVIPPVELHYEQVILMDGRGEETKRCSPLECLFFASYSALEQVV